MAKKILWAYLVVSIANIISQIIASEPLNQFTKPLLIPILIYYVYRSKIGAVTARILLMSLALMLSWIGDIALMFQGKTIFFLIGIGFFLLAQVTYIVVLFRSTYRHPNFDALKVLPFVIYAVGLFKLLLPVTGDFMIPVFIYGIVIAVMAAMARLRQGFTSPISYRLALYGSLLFVLSDSILAINKFYATLPFAGALIMMTYIGAQYLLAEGLLKHAD